jgi:hypothetical protein
MSTNLSCNGSDSQKTEIFVNFGGEENPKATPPAKHGHPSPSTESMGEPPRKFASRERGWVNGMQIDTQNQEGDQVIQGEEGEGGGDEEMPPRNIKVGKDNPPQGPAQCRKTTGGMNFG